MPINKKIAATFSEAMDPATINTTTFTLDQGMTPVPGTVSCTGVTATFTPTSNLAPNTLYTATITTGATALDSMSKCEPCVAYGVSLTALLAGIFLIAEAPAAQTPSPAVSSTLVQDYVWTFTTGAVPDTTPPTVTSTDPANGAIGVPVNKKIAATFSETMDHLTITTATFTLAQGTTPVSGTVTYAGVTAIFNSTSNLAPNTVYTATITTGATDLAGNALASDYVWTFTTGAAPDTTAPMVTSTDPASAAIGVPFNKKIAATFSEAMDHLTITTATFTLAQGMTPVSGTVTYAGVTALFNPTSALAPSTEYTATITIGATDLAGNTLTSDYVWTFTTGAVPDTTAPMVTSTDPANAAIGVPFNKKIAATFSEAMDPLTISTATFTLAQGMTPVSGTVTYAGVTALFNPTSALAPSTEYTATITIGATDLAGNPLASDYVWTFTTGAVPDTTAPMVSFTDPANGAIGVPLNKRIAATFSEAMDPLTITTATFTLHFGAKAITAISGTVTYAGVTATFKPISDLLPNTVYTATMTTGAADLTGNALASDYVWTFTTGATPDTTPPTVIFTAPANGSTVPFGQNLVAVFSEAMDPLTITAATFVVNQGTVLVSGTVTYVGVSAIFNPTHDLAPNTLYTVSMGTGATDLAGNAMASGYVWTFTTGAAPDTTAPTVSSTAPANGTTGVPLGGNLAVTFSEVMNPLTISTATFTLDQGTTPVAGAVTYVGVTAMFNPTTPFTANTVYTATITSGAADVSGNTLASDYVWTFTTGAVPDTTAPTVSSTAPANGTTGLPVNANLAATFSEGMNPLTITTATFTLDQGTTPVLGAVIYTGITARFAPMIALRANTVYTSRITTGAADLAGNALASDYVWSFTTAAALDTSRPTVSFTVPANGSTNVPVGGNFTATFSEAMDPLTITTATVRLDEGIAPNVLTPVPGAVTYIGLTARFNPTIDLIASTVYTATITTGVADLSGNAMASTYVWHFWAGTAPDTTRPTVSFTAPANGGTNVPVGGNFAATFSEAMDPVTITTATVTLSKGISPGALTPIPGAVTYAGVTAMFNPTIDLTANAVYTATITTGAGDLSGNTLASPYVWTFTTGALPDTTPPTVSFTMPANKATGVPVGGNFTVTFSEAMDPVTITTLTVTLDKGIAPAVLTPVLGVVSYAGVTAMFNPTIDLDPNTTYTATVWMEAADLAGNTLASDHEWTFTTGAAPDITAPTVNSTDPADGASGVAINKKIAATFSKAMNPLTITTATFTLHQGTTPVLGAVACVGSTATFTPAGGLAANTAYTATITAGATDLAGNALASNQVWSFTTGTAPDTTAPTVGSTGPVNGATHASVSGIVVATFSEAMDPLTITTLSFTVDQGTTPVSGAVTYADGTATFTAATALAPYTAYTVTVRMEATDLAGNPLASDYVWTFTTGEAPVDLGAANMFAVLAGSTVTNTGASNVYGDLGVFPGTAVVGFPPGMLLGLMFSGAGSPAEDAEVALSAALIDAAARSTNSISLPGDLSGLTLYPGLYTNASSVMLSAGNVTLDAQGEADAVFLFQMGSTLTTIGGTQVILSGGAKATNIYWQVGSSATLGTTSVFRGNILAAVSITISTGATLEGRALTRDGAVTLDTSTIRVPAL